MPSQIRDISLAVWPPMSEAESQSAIVRNSAVKVVVRPFVHRLDEHYLHGVEIEVAESTSGLDVVPMKKSLLSAFRHASAVFDDWSQEEGRVRDDFGPDTSLGMWKTFFSYHRSLSLRDWMVLAERHEESIFVEYEICSGGARSPSPPQSNPGSNGCHPTQSQIIRSDSISASYAYLLWFDQHGLDMLTTTRERTSEEDGMIVADAAIRMIGTVRQLEEELIAPLGAGRPVRE